MNRSGGAAAVEGAFSVGHDALGNLFYVQAEPAFGLAALGEVGGAVSVDIGLFSLSFKTQS